jgi:hypothetical protein
MAEFPRIFVAVYNVPQADPSLPRPERSEDGGLGGGSARRPQAEHASGVGNSTRG